MLDKNAISPPSVTRRASRLGASRPRFRPRSPRTVTAIDTDGRTVWIAQAASKGDQVEISRIESLPLELPPEADLTDPSVLGAGIGKALRSLRLKPGAVVMGVPRTKLILRTINVPVIDDIRELASVIHFQINKDLPFRSEEAVIDFKIRGEASMTSPLEEPPTGVEMTGGLGSPASSKMEVLVAAVQKAVVSFAESVAEAAGVQLSGLGLRAYANARCLEASGVAPPGETVAFVSLGPSEAHIDVIRGDTLLFSRGATIKAGGQCPPSVDGGAHPAARGAERPEASEAGSPNSFVESACIEVVRTLHSSAGLFPDSPIARILTAGASGFEEGMASALASRFPVPCGVFDPSTLPELPFDSVRHARGAVSAIGLAMGAADPAGLPLNFLDPKKPAVERNLVRRRVLISLTTAAALFLILVVARVRMVSKRLAISSEIQAELVEAEKKRSIYRAMRQQAVTVNDWLKGSRDWLDHYAYLSAVLPPAEDLFVSSLTISGQGAIRLSVQARSGEILSKLDKQLRTAGYDVKPLAITPGIDRFGYDFRSTVELGVPEKLRIDIASAQFPARPADDASLEPGALKGGRP